jgi:hypothetical protein
MMVRITNYRIFRGRYLIMQDDCQGWKSGDAGASAAKRVAHGFGLRGSPTLMQITLMSPTNLTLPVLGTLTSPLHHPKEA